MCTWRSIPCLRKGLSLLLDFFTALIELVFLHQMWIGMIHRVYYTNQDSKEASNPAIIGKSNKRSYSVTIVSVKNWINNHSVINGKKRLSCKGSWIILKPSLKNSKRHGWVPYFFTRFGVWQQIKPLIKFTK